jgi:transcriptional regulator with XRE-family HTH domain
VFYDNFLRLCNQKGISPTSAVMEMGFQKSVVTRWKKSIPTDANKLKIAQYFGVSVADLMSEQKEKPAQAQTNTSELDQAFFRVMKSAQDKGYSPHDIELALDFIKRARERDQK